MSKNTKKTAFLFLLQLRISWILMMRSWISPLEWGSQMSSSLNDRHFFISFHFFFNLSKYIATQEFFSCVNVEMANSFRLWTFNHQPISSPLISIYLPIWNDVPHITRSNGGSRHFYSRLTVNHIYPYSFERPHNICFMQYAYRQTKFRKFKLWVKASLNYSFGKR